MPSFKTMGHLILKILKVLAMYGHGGNLGSFDQDHFYNKICHPLPKEAPHKFSFEILVNQFQRRGLNIMVTNMYER